jgi:hypothetical protein
MRMMEKFFSEEEIDRYSHIFALTDTKTRKFRMIHHPPIFIFKISAELVF